MKLACVPDTVRPTQLVLRGTKMARIAIAGAGTVGKFMAYLLARQGVRSVLVDSMPKPSAHNHPRAHVLNTRSMELMREAGLEDEIHAVVPPQDQWRTYRYMHSVFGEELGALDHLEGRSYTSLRDHSPAAVTHLSQPLLDNILLRRLEEYERRGLVRVMWDTAVTGAVQDGDSVGLQVAGRAGTSRLSAEYVIAADGAGSRIREQYRVGLSGQTGLQHFVSVHFTVTDPRIGRRILEAGRPAMLYFLFNQDAIAVLVAHNIERGEWVAQLPFFPPHQPHTALDHTRCQALIHSCFGEEVPHTVHSITPWSMNAVVADRFSQGRVFFVGDAAHQFPPAGGFGLNTGLQDTHNLAWKLAAVLSGEAEPRALDTYHAERHPIALQLRDLSVDNFRRGLKVPEAMGLSHNALSLFSNILPSQLPSPLRQTVLESVMSLGRGQAAWLTDCSPFRGAIRAAVAGALSREQALPMLFPHHDIGLAYASKGAGVVRRVPPQNPPHSEGVAQFVPSCMPGRRVPHMWLLSSSGHVVSSLDLVCLDLDTLTPTHSPRFALLVDSSQAGRGWLDAWDCLVSEGKGNSPDVAAYRMGDNEEGHAWLEQTAHRTPTFTRTEGGFRGQLPTALLIRPDHHVAWTARESSECSVTELRQALQAALYGEQESH